VKQSAQLLHYPSAGTGEASMLLWLGARENVPVELPRTYCSTLYGYGVMGICS
jgi:hypothetical protein